VSAIVKIHWSREFENEKMWNEVCIWAIEYFGLPGDRFETRANVNYMEFIFKSPKDALLMALRWNAELLEPADLETV
jgi:hypothetical protein